MVGVPPDTPVTTPEEVPIVAMDGLLLVQIPEGVASLSVRDDPRYKVAVPVIPDGSGFTVTGVVMKHPLGKV